MRLWWWCRLGFLFPDLIFGIFKGVIFDVPFWHPLLRITTFLSRSVLWALIFCCIAILIPCDWKLGQRKWEENCV